VGDARVGEVRFERPDPDAPRPALLLKLLFTDEPLSIQVHPDDTFARSIGLDNGKAEAWYVLDAHPHAGVGVGLRRKLSATRLRSAIADRSIASLIAWRRVREGDVVSVPAGMIHTIGAGLVLAEIQQRSDATFRLFDHDRGRGIHTENAIAASDTSLRTDPPVAEHLGNGRSIMIAEPHFVLERVVLPPNGAMDCDAPSETWLLVIDGNATIGQVQAARGEAVYASAAHAPMTAGASGATILIAYAGPEPRAAPVVDVPRDNGAVHDTVRRMMEVGR
jgi:mannose-6-phosphate isomerase